VPTRSRRGFLRSISIASAMLALLLGAPSLANAAPPSNDAFASRTRIVALPYTNSVDTEEASLEVGEPMPACGFEAGKTVWYEYTSPVTGVVRVDMQGSSFDTVVAVWKGSDLASLSEVGCNDDNGNDLASLAFFQAEIGSSYFIQVGGYEGEGGNMTIRVDPSTAGGISGTVTSSSGGPLRGICVWLYDGERGSLQYDTLTTSTGAYFFGAIPNGTWKVEFFDCHGRYDHEEEWFENADGWYHADEVVVSAPAVTSGIDAKLRAIPSAVLRLLVNGSGIVRSEPTGIECGWDCEDRYPWDSQVVLTAVPAPGAEFLRWDDCDEVDGNRCIVTLGRDRNVFAYMTWLDDSPPNTVLRETPGLFTASRSARFDWFADGPPARQCSLDGSAFSSCSAPHEYEGLAEGAHTFLVRAVTQSGNADVSPAYHRWVVDTTGPQMTVERPTAGVYVNNQSVGGTGSIVVVGMVSVEVRATDAESGISEVQFEINGDRVEPSLVTSEDDVHRFTFRPPAPGSYEIQARAVNQAGLSKTATVRVDAVGIA
jgi:Bacterial Ig domain